VALLAMGEGDHKKGRIAFITYFGYGSQILSFSGGGGLSCLDPQMMSLRTNI